MKNLLIVVILVKYLNNIEGDEKSMKNYEYNPADHKFEILGEFKF